MRCLAALTGRPKSFYVREALQAHLDEIEDNLRSDKETDVKHASPPDA